MQNYEPNTDQIVALYQQLEDDILRSMVRRMLKMGYVSESTKYESEVLQTAGLLYDDIIQLIADRTDASVQQVRALFEDAGVQTVEIDNEVHEAAGEVPVDIRQDAGMKQVLEASYKKTLGTMRNLVGTTAAEVQNTFIHACDRAYMQVSSGAFSYQEAIRQAIIQASADGAIVRYPSGYTDRIDVAVRRAVLTGVGQTSAAVAKTHAEQAGCYLMELTAHSGARPEHAAWQGQLVSLNGKDVGKRIDGLHVYSLRQIGYGTGTGFKGWNCRHNWHPYYPGLSTPNYTKEQIAKLDEKSISYNGEKYTEYEITQMQRKGERKVRALKRKAVSLDEAVKAAAEPELKQRLTDDFTAVSVRLKDAESQLKDFCQATGRRRDRFREQTLGFDRSISQKAVQEEKKFLQYLDSDDIINKEKILSGFEKYKDKYPDSNLPHYMVDYKLKEVGIKKGIALPAKSKRAYILPDNSSKRDPYHIMHRMMERHVTDDDLERFMKESKVMFVQWGGQRQTFYSDSGVVVITKFNNEWIYKTAWSKYDFDDETLKILEVVNKYV